MVDLPDAPDEELGHRLRGAIAALTRSEAMPVTCSVGIARAQPVDTPDAVVSRADDAMYAAKGRRH